MLLLFSKTSGSQQNIFIKYKGEKQMAITVITEVKNHNNQKKNAGVTTGNEFIYKIDREKLAVITAVATATGDATLYYSTDPETTPTDFTASSGMVESSLGAQTDNLGEKLPEGIEWVGVEVTSGTWDVNIKEISYNGLK
jgi:hypothetical protein